MQARFAAPVWLTVKLNLMKHPAVKENWFVKAAMQTVVPCKDSKVAVVIRNPDSL